MELISGVLSNNAAKVRIVLGEKAIEFKVIEVPWTKVAAWDPKPAILLENNPRAQVPVLVDESLTLWDSTVIAEYLEDKFPEKPLLPKDPAARAICRLWEDEGDDQQAHVGVLIRDVFLAPPGAALTEEASAALASLSSFWRRCDAQIGSGDYICGQFSLADISVFMTAVFAVTLGSQLEGENLQAWFERMMARPVIKAEVDTVLGAVASL